VSRWLPVPSPDKWQHDPERLRELLRERGLSGAAAGALIGVDSRTIRKWTGGERSMPYSAWYCLVHKSQGMLRSVKLLY